MTQDFPPAIMAMLRECADRNGTEYTGPWEGPNGEPLQDDAEAAIAWIEARASLAQPASVPADGIDYEKLVADAWSLHKYRCGTPTCIAFKNGAEWQAKQAPQPAQAKSRQQEIINSIKSALIRHEAATDAVVATAAGDDPHAATLAGIELEKAAALLATWTQPEYLRVMLAAAPAAPQPAQAVMAPEYAAAVRELAEQSGMSEAQVLRAAVRLYQAEQKGLVTVEHKEQIGPLAAPQPEAQQERDREKFMAGYAAAQADAMRCDLPPMGWVCTRKAGHDGPCAAVQDVGAAECVERGMARLRPAAPSAQAVPQQADTVTLVGVKADGTEHVLGTATMPPKMRAKELVREMFGSIDEETGDDGAMALWVCEQLIEWMQETSLVVTLTNQAEQGGTK